MDTGFNYNGITLNEQDIDLMMIAISSNITELQNAVNQITNITFSIKPSKELIEPSLHLTPEGTSLLELKSATKLSSTVSLFPIFQISSYTPFLCM